MLRAISPFHRLFLKDMYCRHVKTRACLGKGSPRNSKTRYFTFLLCMSMESMWTGEIACNEKFLHFSPCSLLSR